jgi:C-terminal processing protease CtpA/Prc
MFNRLLFVVTLLLVTSTLALAQDELPPAPVINDEGGVQVITGEVAYTNAFFTAGVAEPLVILEDQGGFVARDRGFILPPESQVLGQITSDFFTSPFTYTVQLPFEPQGTLNDVDNNGETDTGVQIFGIAYWTNIWGPSFLEERDLGGGGWSTAYASMRVSNRSETQGEVTGGKYLVYAPDDAQGFPSGFGEDGMLFTEDDPVVGLPQGYTLVDMDTDPFTFDRSERVEVNLIEGEASEADDFSGLSFTEAFDAMVEKFRREYAFTEYKEIDWDQKIEEFRPRFTEAEANDDAVAYELALRDFLWSIPDGHVQMPFTPALFQMFQEETTGGIGVSIREVDDGRTIVHYLTAGGPAEEAGIELRAEILEINGQPVGEVVSETVPWSSPFSTDDFRRLQQLRYSTRFPVGDTVEITYQNPGESEPTTAELTAVPESQSFAFASFLRGTTGYELPVAYGPVEGTNYAIVNISSFFDNERLTIDLWERMIETINDQGVAGLIIDMRSNGGGNGWLATQMAAYFFDEPHVVGNSGFFDQDTQDFYFDPNTERHFILPPEEQRFYGQVAVLISPNCASACEFFSYFMTVEDRAAIVGQYTTAGLGGSVEQFFMPAGINPQFTVGRAVDAEGNIHLEGKGVAPTVEVPVNEETLFSSGDPILEAAIAYLDEALTFEIADSGTLAVGDTVTASILPGLRLRYNLTLPGGQMTTITATGQDDPEMNLILNLYDSTGTGLLLSSDGSGSAELEELEVGDADFEVIVEVTTPRDAGAGTFVLEVTDVTE